MISIAKIRGLVFENKEKLQFIAIAFMFLLGGGGLLAGNTIARNKIKEALKLMPKPSPSPSASPQTAQSTNQNEGGFGDLLTNPSPSMPIVKKPRLPQHQCLHPARHHYLHPLLHLHLHRLHHHRLYLHRPPHLIHHLTLRHLPVQLSLLRQMPVNQKTRLYYDRVFTN